MTDETVGLLPTSWPEQIGDQRREDHRSCDDGTARCAGRDDRRHQQRDIANQHNAERGTDRRRFYTLAYVALKLHLQMDDC